MTRLAGEQRQCGAFVYKRFPPAVLKGLEGESVWLCDVSRDMEINIIIQHLLDGTPKPETTAG
jgi:hypothetical protein